MTHADNGGIGNGAGGNACLDGRTQVMDGEQNGTQTQQVEDAQQQGSEAQGEDERIEFSLLLAGCRNVKAAKAVLEDHGGDVDALKEAEPWMFADAPAKQSGKTGLSNAGVAADEGKDVKRWRSLAGLDDKDE